MIVWSTRTVFVTYRATVILTCNPLAWRLSADTKLMTELSYDCLPFKYSPTGKTRLPRGEHLRSPFEEYLVERGV
jgi:hypothetical protein